MYSSVKKVRLLEISNFLPPLPSLFVPLHFTYTPYTSLLQSKYFHYSELNNVQMKNWGVKSEKGITCIINSK